MMEDDRNDLGILFVHGIGQQTQGDTLIRATDALGRFFEIRPQSADHLELEGAELHPGTGPARAHLHFSRNPADGSEVRHTWLLAESWWAESFQPARFGALIQWAVGFLPYATLSHFGAQVQVHWRRFRDAPGMLLRLGRSVPLFGSALLLLLAPQFALILMALSLLLAVLSLIPLPLVRTPAQWLQTKLAATLGDSGILLSSATNRAAMVEQIRADLRWLSARSRRVAVVAHSQGAALSWEALLGRVPDNVSHLLTHGSGLKKLLQLQVAAADRSGRNSLNWAWASALGQLVAAVFAVALVTPPESGSDFSRLIMVTAWLVLVFLGVMPLTVVKMRSAEPPSRGELLLPGVSVIAVALPLLFMFVTQPRWSWEAAMMAPLMSAACGLVSFQGLLGRFPQGRDRGRMVGVILAAVALASLVLLSPQGLRWQVLIGFGGALFVATIPLFAAVTEDPVAWENVVGSVKARGLLWRDWYASNDPVPAGPITPLGDDSVAITNQGQFHRDHTTYWDNVDEFVADVAATLAGSVGWHLPAVSALVKDRRRWRVGVLRMAGGITGLGVILALWLKGSQLGSLGSQVAHGVQDLLRRLPFHLGAETARAIPELSVAEQGWIGALVVVVPLLLTQQMFAWWWRSWDREEARRTIVGTGFAPEKEPRFVWPLVFYLTALLFFCLPRWAWWTFLPFGSLIFVGVSHWFRRQAPPAPIPPET